MFARSPGWIALAGAVLIASVVGIRFLLVGGQESVPHSSEPAFSLTREALPPKDVPSTGAELPEPTPTFDPQARLAARWEKRLSIARSRPLDDFLKALEETHELLRGLDREERRAYAAKASGVLRRSHKAYFIRELAVWSLFMMRAQPEASDALRSFALSVHGASANEDLHLLRAAVFALGMKGEDHLGYFDPQFWRGVFHGNNAQLPFYVRPPVFAYMKANAHNWLAETHRTHAWVSDRAIKQHVLGLLHARQAREAAIDILHILEPDPDVFREVKELVQGTGAPPEHRKSLVHILGQPSNPSRIDDLRRLLSTSTHGDILEAALQMLPKEERRAGAQNLYVRARGASHDPSHRRSFVRALSEARLPGTGRMIEELTQDDELSVANEAVTELGTFVSYKRFTEIVYTVLSRRDPGERSTRELMHLLNHQSGGKGQRFLRAIATNHPDPEIRRLAKRALKG